MTTLRLKPCGIKLHILIWQYPDVHEFENLRNRSLPEATAVQMGEE